MNRTLAAALAATTCIVAIATPAAAQTREYDIPAGTLKSALDAYVRQSGRQVVYRADQIRSARSPGVRGQLSADAALTKLLEGSGFTIRIDGHLIAIVRSGNAPDRDAAPSTAGEVWRGDAAAIEVSEIVVTGSRIRGSDSASPTTIATRSALRDAGVNDLAGFSRILPQNYTGGQNPGVAGGGDQGGQSNISNSTALNLRGLGPDATLTLINGHRVAYDALNQGVDISAIPLGAIEQVEVVADGASAIYGSDAVGGVVNIRLRRDFEGAELSARLGASTDGGNFQQQYSAVTGDRWSTGGFMLALDANRATPILAGDRDYTRGLDDDQTLISKQTQYSAVLAGRQQITGGLRFELDAQYSERDSTKATAFFVTSNPSVNGLTNSNEVTSYSVTPSLHLDLPSDWTASLETTWGVSRSDSLSRNVRNNVATPGRQIYQNELTNVEVGAEGPLVRLPGGSVRLAVGAGFRNFELDINTQTTSGGVMLTTRDATEKRDARFAYGELSIPVVGPDNRMPGMERLHLTAAARYENYEGIGEVTTPRLGLIYEPHRDVTLRLSWGKSFKIPTLNQINTVEQGALLPSGLFAPQPTPPLPAGAVVLFLGGGNPNLQPERAETWSTTFEVRPVDGLRLAASYFDVDYTGRIASPITDTLSSLGNPAAAAFVTLNPSAADILAIVDGLPQPPTNSRGLPFDANTVAAIVDSRLRNTARERVRGIDITADYSIPMGADRLQLTASASYLDADREPAAGLPVVPRSGVIFTPPDWRARFGASYERGEMQLGGYFNYVGGVRDNRPAFLGDIDPFPTLDLSARVGTTAETGLFSGLEFRLSAINVLNQQPDRIRTSDPAYVPYDSTNQSPIGRFVSLAVTKKW